MEMHDMQEGVYSERAEDGTTIKIYLSRLHTQSKVPEWQKAAASLITAFTSWSITKLVAELLVKYVYAERGYFAIGSVYNYMDENPGQQQEAAILDECIKEYESMKGP